MGFPVNENNTLDYTAATPTSTRLTDGAAEYAAPSEAAMEAAKDLIYSGIDGGLGELVIGNPIVLAVAYSTLEEAEATENDLCLMFAHALDRFAAQQTAAAVEAERARIIVSLEHQAEVWERMKDITPSAELRANVYRSAANIIEQ